MGKRMIEIVPITISDAKLFIREHHRHHKSLVSGLFAAACASDGVIIGVAVVGRPKARRLQDGWTAEVVRLCTDGTPHVASKLYAACWRAARALGWRRLVTYILASEPGTSLVAAGWKCIGECGGGSWSCRSRPRIDKHPLQKKLRWEMPNNTMEPQP